MPNDNRKSVTVKASVETPPTARLMLGIAVIGANSLLLSPVLADVAAALDSTPTAVARAVAAYGGATALSAFLLAPLVDRNGPRRALILALALVSLGILASAAANHWIHLALAQGLAGLGAGVALPAIYALASALAPAGKEAQVLGRVLTGWSLAMVAGVPLAALLADVAGWRAAYIGLGGLAALAWLWIARLPAGRGAEPKPMNAEGTGAPRAILRLPGVSVLLTICLCYMVAFYGVYPFIGDHLQTTLGVSTALAGTIALSYGLGFGLAGFADMLVDRFGARRLFPALLCAIAATYALLVPATAWFASSLLLAFLWGFANHFGLNVLVLLLSRVSPARRGAILGLNSAVTYIGVLIGAGLFGEVYARLGFTAIALLAMACLLAAAALASLGLARPRSTFESALSS